MTTSTVARNASLDDLAAMLKAEIPRKIDFVVPAPKMRMIDGLLHIEGTDPEISEDGVTLTEGIYRPTMVFDEGLANKLQIPVQFLRRMRYNRLPLYDAIVNGLLNGILLHGMDPEDNYTVGDPDERSFMVRCYKADASEVGVARAFLSDKYKTIDYFDCLVAALRGVKEAGVPVEVVSCDLTERRMIVRVKATDVAVHARALLGNYRSPYSGKTADELPLLFAGFEINDSEVGAGRFSIVPRAIFEICGNGMKIIKDAVSAVHLGGKLDEGVVEWSEETREKEIALITSQAADAVKTFLNADYIAGVVAKFEEKAQKPVEATTVVKNVGKKLNFSEETIQGVFDFFARSGEITAGGVMQAVTAYAQTVDDADLAYTLENQAVEALELAAR